MILKIDNPRYIPSADEDSIILFVDEATMTLKGKRSDGEILSFTGSFDLDSFLEGITVSAADVKAGKKFINSSGALLNGTMSASSVNKNNNTVTVTAGYINERTTVTVGNIFNEFTVYTPGTSDRIIPANSWLANDIRIKGEPNLIAENIKKGVTIFGITGTCEGGSSPTPTITINANTECTLPKIYVDEQHGYNLGDAEYLNISVSDGSEWELEIVTDEQGIFGIDGSYLNIDSSGLSSMNGSITLKISLVDNPNIYKYATVHYEIEDQYADVYINVDNSEVFYEEILTAGEEVHIDLFEVAGVELGSGEYTWNSESLPDDLVIEEGIIRGTLQEATEPDPDSNEDGYSYFCIAIRSDDNEEEEEIIDFYFKSQGYLKYSIFGAGDEVDGNYRTTYQREGVNQIYIREDEEQREYKICLIKIANQWVILRVSDWNDIGGGEYIYSCENDSDEPFNLEWINDSTGNTVAGLQVLNYGDEPSEDIGDHEYVFEITGTDADGRYYIYDTQEVNGIQIPIFRSENERFELKYGRPSESDPTEWRIMPVSEEDEWDHDYIIEMISNILNYFTNVSPIPSSMLNLFSFYDGVDGEDGTLTYLIDLNRDYKLEVSGAGKSFVNGRYYDSGRVANGSGEPVYFNENGKTFLTKLLDEDDGPSNPFWGIFPIGEDDEGLSVYYASANDLAGTWNSEIGDNLYGNDVDKSGTQPTITLIGQGSGFGLKTQNIPAINGYYQEVSSNELPFRADDLFIKSGSTCYHKMNQASYSLRNASLDIYLVNCDPADFSNPTWKFIFKNEDGDFDYVCEITGNTSLSISPNTSLTIEYYDGGSKFEQVTTTVEYIEDDEQGEQDQGDLSKVFVYSKSPDYFEYHDSDKGLYNVTASGDNGMPIAYGSEHGDEWGSYILRFDSGENKWIFTYVEEGEEYSALAKQDVPNELPYGNYTIEQAYDVTMGEDPVEGSYVKVSKYRTPQMIKEQLANGSLTSANVGDVFYFNYNGNKWPFVLVHMFDNSSPAEDKVQFVDETLTKGAVFMPLRSFVFDMEELVEYGVYYEFEDDEDWLIEWTGFDSYENPWGESPLRSFMNGPVFNRFDQDLRNVISEVKTAYPDPNVSDNELYSNDKIFIPSLTNVNILSYNYRGLTDDQHLSDGKLKELPVWQFFKDVQMSSPHIFSNHVHLQDGEMNDIVLLRYYSAECGGTGNIDVKGNWSDSGDPSFVLNSSTEYTTEMMPCFVIGV
jgi:hypothetical protein